MRTCSRIATLIVLQVGSLSHCQAQSLTPSVFPAAGGSYSDANCTVSWTIGEPMNASFSNANGTLTQGQQQSFATVCILNLRAYIQGFYCGGDRMNAVVDPTTRPLDCDTVTLKLAATAAPYSIQFSSTAILTTTGDAVFRFPLAAISTSYYLVLQHRNSLEVWSSTAVALNVNTSYNFTTSAAVAYGSNLANLGDGNFALWSGDIDQNGQIDLVDLNAEESALQNFLIGYVLSDITGDCIAEASDYSLLENNVASGKTILRP